MERRKEEDPDGYRVYGLGEWGELGGLILTNFEVHDFPTERDYFDGFYYGQDFGFNHADAILGVGWKDGEIYVTSEVYVFEKDTEEIISPGPSGNGLTPRVEMFCDSAEPDRIRTWQKAGFRAYPVKKRAWKREGPDRLPERPKDTHTPFLCECSERSSTVEVEKGPDHGPLHRRTCRVHGRRYGGPTLWRGRPRRGSSIEVLK